VHDGITGLKGSFAGSLAAVRLLKAAGVAVKIKVPLMNLNLGQAAFLKRQAGKEGCGISFDPVIAPANDGDRAALKYRLSGPELRKAVAHLSPSGAEAGPAAQVPGSADAWDFLCGAGRNVCAVDPAGNLYPCLQLPVKLGNLTRSGFAALWRGFAWLKKWRSAGLKDLKDCGACPDIEFCSRCPGISLLEEGDAFAPNRPACELAAALRKKYGGS
jgi:radical SAM protein with 4Fe4S-binding SPASM domain